LEICVRAVIIKSKIIGKIQDNIWPAFYISRQVDWAGHCRSLIVGCGEHPRGVVVLSTNGSIGKTIHINDGPFGNPNVVLVKRNKVGQTSNGKPGLGWVHGYCIKLSCTWFGIVEELTASSQVGLHINHIDQVAIAVVKRDGGFLAIGIQHL